MAEKLVFEYDKVGDILYVTTVPPYAEQESEELQDEVVARLNPSTGAVEGLEILNVHSQSAWPIRSFALGCAKRVPRLVYGPTTTNQQVDSLPVNNLRGNYT